MDYKKFLTVATVVFLGLVVFLTFFASALADINIPRVSVEYAKTQTLVSEAVGAGILEHADKIRVFATTAGRVTGPGLLPVYAQINEGDMVLSVLSAVDALQDRLLANQHERSLNALLIQQLQSDRQQLQARLGRLRLEPLAVAAAPVLNVWEIEAQIDANARSRQTVLSDIAGLVALYEAGAIPRVEVARREADLESLEIQGANLQQNLALALERHETELANHESNTERAQRERNEQIRSMENSVAGLDFQLERALLEAARLENQMQSLTEQIDAGGILEVFSEFYGPHIVLEVNPALQVGSMVAEDTWIMTIAPKNNLFTVSVPFSHVHDFVADARAARIRVRGLDLAASISRVQPEGGNFLLTAQVTSEYLTGGELVQVVVQSVGVLGRNVIPISALRQDTMGYYVLCAVSDEERGGEYFIQAVRVTGVAKRTVHYADITFWVAALPGPVVTRSDVPVSPGARVRPQRPAERPEE